jgi:pilus assembly protein CpaE
MLRALIISNNGRDDREFASVLSEIPELEVARTFDQYPSLEELVRAIRLRSADVCFIDASDFVSASGLVSSLDHLMTGYPVITYSGLPAMDLLPQLMRLGIREHISLPPDAGAVAAAIERVRKRLASRPVAPVRLPDLFTFLPATPGAGASTVAIGASCALAENLGVHTLLMDCDLAAGAVQFLLKLGNCASILDALIQADELDEELWSRMVAHWGKLDILHAGEHHLASQIDFSGLGRLLRVARSLYDVVCVDLASSIDPFSTALMRESHKVFVVTTPEMVSLHMATTRIKRLTDLGLKERVSVLLSRDAGRLPHEEIEAAVGAPVVVAFPNDYAGVQSAILNAAPVSSKSPLGSSVLNLAHFMAPQATEQKVPSAKRKFLEFFRVGRHYDEEAVWKD